jgi:2-methylaconitate cis-trans-isomerase PrpF
MRKLAIVERLPDAPDGTPVLAYTFGQVDAELRRVDFSGECGNVAAGVPLFASLFGWCAAPGSGGSAWLHLTNTGKRVLTTWSAGDRHGGTVQLEFVTPVLAGASVLPHGVPQRVTERPGGGTIRHSVVHALNRYVFIDSRDLGIADPVAADVTEALFDEVRLVLASIAAHRPGTPPKVCLVAPAAGREGTVRARILYPDGRWSHPGFAVTGAVTLAVGCCLEGSVLAPCRGAHHINIEHPGGTLAVRWTPGDGGLPASVSLRRDVRLLLRGAAF